jgi:hypothetical protein
VEEQRPKSGSWVKVDCINQERRRKSHRFQDLRRRFPIKRRARDSNPQPQKGAPHFECDATCPETLEKAAFPDAMGAPRSALETKSTPTEPDLQAVIDAWQDLPEAIKTGILAMVRASAGS